MFDTASSLPIPVWLACSAGAVLGLLCGSFIANLTALWPQGRSALGGRSACESCDKTLTAGELIPLVSFALQHGRCRACAAPIGIRYPIIEAVAGAIGASAALAPPPVAAAGLLFGLILLALAVLDLENFWLPDRLTFPLIGLGLAVSPLGLGPGFRDAALGAAAGLLFMRAIGTVYRLARRRAGLGGGDAKLLAGIGAWIGWQALPFVLLLASGAGLIVALVLKLGGWPIRARTRMPFGTMLAAAAWAVWLWLFVFVDARL